MDCSTQASLSLTIFWSLPRFMFIASESSVHIKWPKFWSFSFNISHSSEYSGLISLQMPCLISLMSKGLSGVYSSTTVWRHQFFGILLSLWTALTTICDHWEDHTLDYTDFCGQSNVSALLFFFFSFIFINWRLITLQYCSGFCHTLTWISHGFTSVPHPDPRSHTV